MKFKTSLYIKKDTLVEIYAFCLMPNHFHFQLKQLQEDGVQKFMRNLQNAYAKYFNTKYQRHGSLFQLMFKAVRIENDEQLLHVNRYIHLNPLTSYILKDFSEIYNFRWSSFRTYTVQRNYRFVNINYILNLFNGDVKKFISFTANQLEYQRLMHKIKHLTLE